MNEKNIGIVKFELQSGAPLTEHEREQLDHLRDVDDSCIDFGDAPATGAGAQWKRSGTSNTKLTTISLEEDVFDFFRTDGIPDATRVNAVLREYMQSHSK